MAQGRTRTARLFLKAPIFFLNVTHQVLVNNNHIKCLLKIILFPFVIVIAKSFYWYFSLKTGLCVNFADEVL